MRVAVCDNDRDVADVLNEQIQKISHIHDISVFSSIDRLFCEIGDGQSYDLIFMDIDWDQEKNGMDFGKELLQICPRAQIVYVTGYSEKYSQQIFLQKSNLVGFLVKPVEENILSKLLQKAEDNLDTQFKEKLQVYARGVTELIPFAEILYLENKGHKTVIHKKEGIFEINKQLEILRDKLPKYFLYCHKSFSVNMNYIERIDKSSVTLINNDTVPVSKSRYPEARDSYYWYLGENL